MTPFVEHLQCGLGAVFQRAAGGKNQFVVHFQTGLAESAAIAFKRSCAHGAAGGPVK